MFSKEWLIGLINDIYGDDFINAAVKAINVPSGTFDNMVNALSEAVTPIASVLICIYFILAVADKMTSDNFSSEQFIKLLMKLVLSIAVTDNITTLSLKIMNFGVAFSSLMAANAGAFASVDATSLVENMSLGTRISVGITMLIPWMASLLLKVAIYVIGLGRSIEIGLRAGLAPIGCADLISGGTSSNGIRYLKKMIGISIQGGIMLVVISSAGALCQYVLPDSASLTNALFIAQYMGIMAAMVGIMASSKSLAFELIGA